MRVRAAAHAGHLVGPPPAAAHAWLATAEPRPSGVLSDTRQAGILDEGGRRIMGWSGTMVCDVHNRTGGTIAVVAQHVLGNQTDRFSFSVLEDDQREPFRINVGSGSNDLWSLWFMDANGTFWYRHEKQCNVEREDYASGENVRLILWQSSFSIAMPRSSSCNSNFYYRNDGGR